MRRRISFVLAAIAATAFGACSRPSNSQSENANTSLIVGATDYGKLAERVIYGADDRHDLYSEPDARIRELADSTVALIKSELIEDKGDGTWQIKTKLFGDNAYICPTEPYRDQQVAPHCTGFLVGPQTIISAGHCIISDNDCAIMHFVFGFSLTELGKDLSRVSGADVYRCKSIKHSQAPSSGADFAVVELDRPVTNHWPLKLRQSGMIGNGESVSVIGHPSGLPMKIAGGAGVRDTSPTGYFVANLDTHGGNSGSPVFNASTLEVEGILVRGEADYAWDSANSCIRSNVCENAGCRGEDVTKILEAKPWLAETYASRPLSPERGIVALKRSPSRVAARSRVPTKIGSGSRISFEPPPALRAHHELMNIKGPSLRQSPGAKESLTLEALLAPQTAD